MEVKILIGPELRKSAIVKDKSLLFPDGQEHIDNNFI